MVQHIGGDLNGTGLTVGIAATRWNTPIVDSLVDGCIDGLVRHGVADESISVVRCPGSWELPMIIRKMAESDKYDAVVALGAIIRGETPHYDYLAAECVKGLGQVAHQAGKPVIFGVLTTDTVEQAMNRAGIKHGNKGFECAEVAIEMANVLRDI